MALPLKVVLQLILTSLFVGLGVLMATQHAWKLADDESVVWPLIVIVLGAGFIGGLLFIADQTYYEMREVDGVEEKVNFTPKKWRHILFVAALGVGACFVLALANVNWPWVLLGTGFALIALVALQLWLVVSKTTE